MTPDPPGSTPPADPTRTPPPAHVDPRDALPPIYESEPFYPAQTVKSVGWIEIAVGKLVGDSLYRMLLEHIVAHAFVLGGLVGLSVAIEWLTHTLIDPCASRYAFLGFHLLEIAGLSLKFFVVFVVVVLIVDQGANIFRRFWRRLWH